MSHKILYHFLRLIKYVIMRIFSCILFFSLICLNVSAQDIVFEFNPSQETPSIKKESLENGLSIYTFRFNVEKQDKSIQISWHIPANDMHIYFTSQKTGGVNPDWSSQLVQSRATANAPLVSLINNSNQNRLTFAASDALNSLKFHSGVVEETAQIINKIVIKPTAFKGLKTYEIKIRIDQRTIPYWKALDDVSKWWASFDNYTPLTVPDIAKLPMYSTWYSFHQSLKTQDVINECKLAKSLGCGAVIVDDGWQTVDSNRGYKFTGDWKPERIPEMKTFVDSIHAIGMKFILWYSVPFVGTGSEAYKQFKGKLLNDRSWSDSYVLDPRYPEVREHLINIYANALTSWNIDGFKLDFVNAFNSSTAVPFNEGMDFSNVDKATDRLLTDVSLKLKSIKKDVLIEFRQPYVGPLMRKYGNMFRATDCPYSFVQNRVRTSQIKLLAGHTATHSDMIMWHPEEPVEAAALQLLNVMFSVPQISVMMNKYPDNHRAMLKFWLSFWMKHQDLLLDGKFEAHHPHLNFPLLISKTQEKFVAGVYATNTIVPVKSEKKYFEISVINASGDNAIYLQFSKKATKKYKYTIFNCTGETIEKGTVKLNNKSPIKFNVPKAGLLQMRKF